MAAIQKVEARYFRLPLAEVLYDAMHGSHTHFELITAAVTLADGSQGTGYTYTGGRGGRAIQAMIEHDLAPFLVGRDGTEVEARHEDMRWHIHYVGRGGLSAFAIAAVDIALWDARGKRTGQSLAKMAGGGADRCKAYVGGIDLNYSLDKLLDSVGGSVAQGFNGVKIKLGQPDLTTDIDRVLAVRDRIGPDVTFMVDANFGWDVDTAIAAAKAMEPARLTWFEEPTDPDDLDGYKRIAAESPIPLAVGENAHTDWDFRHLAASGAVRYLQPDAGTCGGITTWLRAADTARDHGAVICTHGMQELHVSLMAGRASPGWLEVHAFPIDQYTTRPLVVEDHLAVAPDVAGIGVTFDWDKLEAAS